MSQIHANPGGSHVTRSAERAEKSGGGVPVEQRRPNPRARKTSRRVTYQPTLEQKLFRCWSNGLGIGMTMLAIKRHLGVDLSHEKVRVAFAGLAEKFA